jgi:hypothetical protein
MYQLSLLRFFFFIFIQSLIRILGRFLCLTYTVLYLYQGGENVARGSLIGALLGAAHGIDAFPAWSHKLYNKNEIMEEIDTFVSSTCSVNSNL